MNSEDRIKAEAIHLGFSAVGIAAAGLVPEGVLKRYREHTQSGEYDGLSYLLRNEELRFDPSKLVPHCQSIIMVALNYFPREQLPADSPQIAYYAYGKDYHRVVKRRLDKLLCFIREEIDQEVSGRSFADSAPILERYWAEQAGIGWQGKSGLIVIPEQGTFFVLGSLLLSTPLIPDKPIKNACGDCQRCIEACPTQAISGDSIGGFRASRCLSYLTIEQAGELPTEAIAVLGKRLFGCDSCQTACPHNRFALPNTVEEFQPTPQFLALSEDVLTEFSESDYQHYFAGSAVCRAGFEGMQRNIRAYLSARDSRDKEGCYIHGQYYDSANIDELPTHGDGYMQEIVDFLRMWFSPSSTIPLQTSGSTGTPKVLHANKDAMRRSAQRSIETFCLRRGDKVLLALPMRYIAAQMMLVRALLAKLDLYPVEPTSLPLSNIPHDLSFRFAPLVPLQVSSTLAKRDGKQRLAQIDTILLGGAALSAKLESELANEPTHYFMGYGMTETLSHIALRPINGPDRSDYYTLLKGVRIEQDEDGSARIVQTGEKPLKTNDLIELLPDSRFRPIGRSDNTINSGAIKIQPEEVERLLSPFIAPPYACIGLPDERLGERLVLVSEKPLPYGELPSEALAVLPKHFVPRSIICHPIPIGATGKINRRLLRSELAERD